MNERIGPDKAPHPAAIGSVIPSADRWLSPMDGPSVWSAWTADEGDHRLYETARAALAALLAHRAIRRLWLPAYSCRALMEGVVQAGVEPVWYEVDGRLNSDLDAVHAGLAQADAVLAVAFFGRAPKPGFRRIADARPDVLVIEDRAQALDPGSAIDGAVQLYSPRKLLGVADGGLLVGSDLPPPPMAPARRDLWAPNDARASDPNGQDPARWFPAYQAREAAFDAHPRRASDRTAVVLDRIDIAREAQARRRNWRTLATRLSPLALWPDPDPDFTPLAFPVVVPDAAALATHLAGRRIWAARHWADLAAPSVYRQAHQLSRTCVSLPLDSRYGSDDMVRMAEAVIAFA